jgi:putative hemolysin
MPMSWLAKLVPFVWLLSKTTQLVLRLFGLGKDEVAR